MRITARQSEFLDTIKKRVGREGRRKSGHVEGPCLSSRYQSSQVPERGSSVACLQDRPCPNGLCRFELKIYIALIYGIELCSFFLGYNLLYDSTDKIPD